MFALIILTPTGLFKSATLSTSLNTLLYILMRTMFHQDLMLIGFDITNTSTHIRHGHNNNKPLQKVCKSAHVCPSGRNEEGDESRHSGRWNRGVSLMRYIEHYVAQTVADDIKQSPKTVGEA